MKSLLVYFQQVLLQKQINVPIEMRWSILNNTARIVNQRTNRGLS